MSDLQTQTQPDAGNPAPAAAPASTSSRKSRLPLPESTLLRHLLAVLVCAVAAVVLLEDNDPFRHSQLATLSYYAIAAVGLTVLTGLNGQISLGHGALMSVGAYTTGLLYTGQGGLPVPVVMLVAAVLTALVGVVVGAAAARLHGPYLAGATLAMAVAVPGLAIFFDTQLGGEQ